MNSKLTWVKYSTRLNYKVSQAMDSLREVARDWVHGVYLLLHGQLDATIISPKDLSNGLKQLDENCRKVGMKVAPMDNHLEILFSLPVSAVVDQGKIHVWISVPVIQENSPTFNLLCLTHVPIPLGNYMVELAPVEAYLAVDAQKCLHADISTEELGACTQHRRFFFCSRTTFSAEEDSCAMALLKGDGTTAGRLCHTFVQGASCRDGRRSPTQLQRSVCRDLHRKVSSCPAHLWQWQRSAHGCGRWARQIISTLRLPPSCQWPHNLHTKCCQGSCSRSRRRAMGSPEVP
jgi:hypothetical protein